MDNAFNRRFLNEHVGGPKPICKINKIRYLKKITKQFCSLLHVQYIIICPSNLEFLLHNYNKFLADFGRTDYIDGF